MSDPATQMFFSTYLFPRVYTVISGVFYIGLA